MLVSEGLDTPIMIEFQTSLVVVSESCLQVMNASAEGGGGQGRSPKTQQCHTFPFHMVDPGHQLHGSNGAAIPMAAMAMHEEPKVRFMEAACHHWMIGW